MDVYDTRAGVYTDGSLDITGCVLAVMGGMVPDLRYEVDDS